jgi:NAD(P)-dependent dehydrogenase (short-subunit alcohol dehydrogenase family)
VRKGIMKTLEGKVAVITGGSSGIGLATAKLFQQVGARVAISGRNQKSLDDAVKELGAGVVAVRSDVSKLGDLDTLFAVVTKKLGRIDVLFANAGIAKFAPVAESRRPPTTRHSTSTLRGCSSPFRRPYRS